MLSGLFLGSWAIFFNLLLYLLEYCCISSSKILSLFILSFLALNATSTLFVFLLTSVAVTYILQLS